jgi:triosephosphate isomerase (TIM)
MSKRTPLIAGNWKMHKTIAAAIELVKALQHSVQNAGVDVVVAPPFTVINKVAEALHDSFIGVAGQDLFWEDFGAYTGEVSAPMLKDAGAEYVIIGHSERRQYFGETDATVNKKVKAALNHQLIPIFCVGETLEERETNKVEEVIERQVRVGLQDLSEANMQQVVIAYEPVWAIGTGKTASAEQAEAVHVMIRQLLSSMVSPEIADVMRIIYGGSVKASNSKELFAKENIDGALVGGASLKVEDFVGIIKGAV